MARGNAEQSDGTIPVTVLAKRTLDEFKKDDVPEIAAGVAYHAIFAIPPLIALVLALAALLNRVADVPIADRLVDLINENAPDQTRQLLLDLVDGALNQVSGGAALFGVLLTAGIALWSGSNGVSTVMKAFNRAYDVIEDRSFIKLKLTAIGLTLVVGVLVILAFAMLVFGKPIGDAVADRLGLGSVFDYSWSVVQIVAPIIFIMLVQALLFYFAPNVKQSFRWVSPGAVFATVAWIALLFGFRYYTTFANPGSAYGTVGSVVVLMFFLYVSSIIFITGAEVNAVVSRANDPETVRDLAHNLQKIENPLDELAARQAARQMDARKGTHIVEGMAQPILVGPPPEPAPAAPSKPSKPGALTRIVTGVSTLAASMVIARIMKKRQKK
ncbi:MAG: YihY/virulence factor BrkB family protein [Thermomicrobiales bacterium]|nr:YihY/virulence factor BrkB family protein [Thermomicrobiales bacterium]